MNYKHLNQIERYQIHSLMKVQHNIKQIARLLVRDKFTISHEMRRNAGFQGYKGKQASDLPANAPSRNVNTLAPAQRTLKSICKWVIVNSAPSLVPTTSKPSLR